MSPQPSLLIAQSRMSDIGNSHISDIVDVVDVAYQSSHKRLDEGKSDADASVVKSNPLSLSMIPTSGPRFNLRKRKVSVEEPVTSYNSDFLSGIFADIQAASSGDDPTGDEHYITSDEGDSCPSTPVQSPCKKSRVSMSRSLSRCSKSYASLACFRDPALGAQDPSAASTHSSTSSYEAGKNPTNLNLVTNLLTAADMALTAFPHLPATVSESFSSSSADLTQSSDGQHAPGTETNPAVASNTEAVEQTTIKHTEETYGWFLALDDYGRETADAYKNAPKETSLAFQAPTAPNGVDHDAEVEWAKAADTVDDVLGDFF